MKSFPTTSSDRKPSVLIVSGVDPTGGAGLVADIFTVSSLGCKPYVVPSCLTVQSAERFEYAEPVESTVFSDMLADAVARNDISVVKVGLMASADTVRLLSHFIENFSQVIIDPILKPTEAKDYIDLLPEMSETLFPLSTVLTPNIPEACRIAGADERNILTLDDVKSLAKAIADSGMDSVVVKGGHLGGDRVMDVLFNGGKFYIASSERRSGSYHGTGCIFSSALAAYLAQGNDIVASFEKAHRFVHKMIESYDNGWVFPSEGL